MARLVAIVEMIIFAYSWSSKRATEHHMFRTVATTVELLRL
jgi:hypothetical protein